MRRLLLASFLALLAATAVGQIGITSQSGTPGVRVHSRSFGELAASEKTLLSSFCRLDFEGARLQPEGWSRLKPFTALRANPEFRRIVIVTRFDVEVQEENTYTVPVTYKVAGVYDANEGYARPSTVDHVTFHTQEQNGNLVVTSFDPDSPHVSPQAALTWINLRLADAKITDLERAQLDDAAKQIGKLVPHPAKP